MGVYVSEKRAPGICERCGRRCKLRTLASEYIQGKRVGNKVCRECFDKDHPQNWLGRVKVSEAMTLKDPSPPEAEEGRSRPGWDPVGNEAVRMRSSVGQVFVRVS